MYNPVSTYRIQFHKKFTFKDLQQTIPYLHRLGIRTIYASPIFEAVPGSTHGYDGLNPHVINPEIGTEEELLSLSKVLKSYGMGWIQDIVPNHMAFDTRNPWLADVLEKGAESKYTSFFDIAWQSSIYEGRLMVPFLGSSLEDVIVQKQLAVEYSERRFFFRYFDALYPLHPRSYVTICRAGEEAPPEIVQHWLSEIETIRTDADVDTFAANWERCLQSFSVLMQDKEVAAYISGCIELVNASPEALNNLLAEQVYRLCHWQETDGRINYRRFFTVNGLICLNMQDPAVFYEYHQYIFKFVEDGIFQGLRIDHIDGLYDPETYLRELRNKTGEHVYIIIEKILEAHEQLPDWPVQGTSGYEYLAWVNNLGTNRAGEKGFTQFYYSLVEEHKTVPQQVRDKKSAILYHHMGGELDNLFHLFMELIEPEAYAMMRTEDIKTAIAEFLIHCPVYRYYGNALPLSQEETSWVQEVLNRVRESREDLSPAVQLLESRLLYSDHPHQHNSGGLLHFYRRCMQLAGPLMAKGVEDTLMYTFNRFIVHNEVGDAADAFGISTDDFHQRMKERQQSWPLALNASATHDTKRGEDVRARLNVLSDIPAEWIQKVDEWHGMNKRLGSDGGPDPNDEYFIYQTLIGTYPFDEEEEGYDTRLTEYLQKALREGKRRSNWSQPDEAYETAVASFATALLDKEAPFWKSFHSILKKVRDHGVINSLVQVILKTTCPGVPDVYQGTEFWDLSFVDPDNRRPVDYGGRLQALEEIEASEDKGALFKPLWLDRKSGRIKLWLTQSMLQLRQQYAMVFTQGSYVPLSVSGSCKDHVFAFARIHRGTCIIVVVPLHTAAQSSNPDVDIDNMDWEDTTVAMPRDATGNWQNLLSGEKGDVSSNLKVADHFKQHPFAILRTTVTEKERGAGILLHITSLPSSFGIGDMGPQARYFADFLAGSKQKYWQVLPINPTEGGQGHSPYSATSSRAGNTLLISPELLVSEGLLETDVVQKEVLPQSGFTDFTAAAEVRQRLLDLAWTTFQKGTNEALLQEFEMFCSAEKEWLDDFALYTSLKEQHGGKPWYEWPKPLRQHDTGELKALAEGGKDTLTKIKWLQFIFSRQWQGLKGYCNERGILLIGDVPFYVSYDSADVWSNQHLFALDEEGQRTGIAGVPPDSFSADGQLWGMPVFKWDVLEETGYAWWVERLKKNNELFDLVRLDHFRAFAAYWE
ncbi:MAG TPA: malto-oligosyltrehalose synthase, partial [Flavisolibacter sp.]